MVNTGCQEFSVEIIFTVNFGDTEELWYHYNTSKRRKKTVSSSRSQVNESSGVYTYSQVIKKLGVAPSTLTVLVDKGVIEKVVPPGKKNGYYTRTSVDDYYNQQNVFLDTYITKKENRLVVRKALEEDQESIFEFEKSIYPDPAPLENRLEWFHKNNDIDFVALLNGEVIGHLSLLPMKEETIIRYLEDKNGHWFGADDIERFESGKQYSLYIMSAAIKQFEDLHTRRLYAGYLLQRGEKHLVELAEQGKVVKKIFARSRTETGIFLANRMELELVPKYSTHRRRTFVLDMGESESKWAKKYREVIEDLQLPAKMTKGILNAKKEEK